MIGYDFIVEYEIIDANNIKILLSTTLFADTFEVYKPKFEYVGNETSAETKELIKIYNDEIWKKYKKGKKVFAPMAKGKIGTRTLDYKFDFPDLQIDLFTDNYETFDELFQIVKGDHLYYSELPIDSITFTYEEYENSIQRPYYGCLEISRIIFNRRFDKGYVWYMFYCGEACVWAYIVEIVKINGKWKIGETLDGAIA
jgi:hypothetical protein